MSRYKKKNTSFHLVVIAILVFGLVAGTFLALKRQNINSKAASLSKNRISSVLPWPAGSITITSSNQQVIFVDSYVPTEGDQLMVHLQCPSGSCGIASLNWFTKNDSIWGSPDFSVNSSSNTQCNDNDGDGIITCIVNDQIRPQNTSNHMFESTGSGGIGWTVTATLCQGGCVLPTPTPAPFYKAFVTSTTYNGNLKGTYSDALTGADAKCQSRAVASGLTGTFKAWLSTDTPQAHAKDRILDVQYKRVDGVVIANGYADLIDGTLQNPINKNEHGVIKNGDVWTGTNWDGTNELPLQDCLNWTASGNVPPLGGSTGYSLNSNSQWTDNGYSPSCGGLRSLYCFQTEL